MRKTRSRYSAWTRWWAWHKVSYEHEDSVVSVRWEYVERRKYTSNSGYSYWEYREYTKRPETT